MATLGQTNAAQLPTDGEREFQCDHCRARCTRSPTDPSIEYGHIGGCPDRPDELDSNSHRHLSHGRYDYVRDEEGSDDG